jgi:hypothetical protein
MTFVVECANCRHCFQVEHMTEDDEIEAAAAIARGRDFDGSAITDRSPDRTMWTDAIDAQEWDSIQAGEWSWYTGKKL